MNGSQACRQAPYAVGSVSRVQTPLRQLTLPNLLMNSDTNKSKGCHHAAQLHVAVCQSARVEASSPAKDLGHQQGPTCARLSRVC